VSNTSLDKYLDDILRVDVLKTYKPKPEVYNMSAKKLCVNKEYILFVSSNGWDITGAKAFGFVVGWVNRLNKPCKKLGFKPDYVVSNIQELIERIQDL
jgi:2-haloacid dehalogenase